MRRQKPFIYLRAVEAVNHSKQHLACRGITWATAAEAADNRDNTTEAEWLFSWPAMRLKLGDELKHRRRYLMLCFRQQQHLSPRAFSLALSARG